MLTRDYIEGLERVAREAPHLRQLGPERLREALGVLAAEGWLDVSEFVRAYAVGLELLVQDLEDELEVST